MDVSTGGCQICFKSHEIGVSGLLGNVNDADIAKIRDEAAEQNWGRDWQSWGWQSHLLRRYLVQGEGLESTHTLSRHK